MIKFLTLFLLFFTFLHSKEYPIVFSKMGTPLYKSIEPIKKLSTLKEIKKSSLEYLKKANKTLNYGYRIDNEDGEVNPKIYLLKLRKLQKKHDYILHLLHKEINHSINKKDYPLFIKLTNYKLDGLLKSKSLLEKSIKFYKKNKNKSKSKLLEEKIAFQKNLQSTQEFFNMVHRLTFDPSKQETFSNRSVNITSRQVGDTIIIGLENKNPYSVTIKLNPKYKNIKYDKDVPTLVVLKAKTKKEYIRFGIKKGSSSYSYNYTWIIGSIDAVHDDSYLYRLPYKVGTSHVVSQGYNGKFTHKGHSQYAIDFAMDIGTPLCAVRSGVVVKTKSDSNKRGDTKEFAKYGNYITIEHDDGTLATYYHLKRNGVGVVIGQIVERGQVIGYSGNTGFSRGPHLHFAILKPSSASKIKSLPIKFITTNGVINNPKKGTYYRAK
ncbi:MAG: M23 family metallopeptidase [Sulfurimonas sp.]|nr:M23 family metallopeptidase [Sulfurimonas sp.]